MEEYFSCIGPKTVQSKQKFKLKTLKINLIPKKKLPLESTWTVPCKQVVE